MMTKKLKYGCKGLVAVISGGTSGIGLATARSLAADGARVFVLGRDKARGGAAEAELKELGKASYVQCDVTQSASCKEAAEAVAKAVKGAGVDILVNSAGVYAEQRLENVTEADYAAIMDTNVKGTLFLTQALQKQLKVGGAIVNIASDAGVHGNYGCPLYCASKGAIVALTRALALDFAPDVRVNCVCPADVDTPLLARQLVDANEGYTLSDMEAAYPLGRIARVEEIAHVICGIATPANSFMTGSIIAVDGGVTAG